MTITKPMLAAKIKTLKDIKFPVIVSPKLDGIRCLRINGKALSRSFKPIANKHINKLISENLVDGMDGEVLSGTTFQDCSSAVMSHKGEPKFIFHAFDYVSSDIAMPYWERVFELDNIVEKLNLPWLVAVPHYVVSGLNEFNYYEQLFLEQGYEGIIVRDPEGPYKCGRSTLKQGWLLKMKSESDSEAQVLGFEEMMHNENEKETNELGHSKRSASKEGKVPANTLGKFLCRDIKSGVEFAIGTGQGLTLELRQEIWNNQSKYVGKLIKYRYQDVGVKEKPRCPSFLGFRSKDDM